MSYLLTLIAKYYGVKKSKGGKSSLSLDNRNWSETVNTMELQFLHMWVYQCYGWTDILSIEFLLYFQGQLFLISYSNIHLFYIQWYPLWTDSDLSTGTVLASQRSLFSSSFSWPKWSRSCRSKRYWISLSFVALFVFFFRSELNQTNIKLKINESRHNVESHFLIQVPCLHLFLRGFFQDD